MKALILISSLFFASISFAAKTYQVTGPVVEVTDSKIVVEKGKEKWEIDRTPETKVKGDLKAGQKVTIEYTMSAKDIEVKESKEKKK
ncbi:MAG: hypothetical protein ACXVCY_15410 [Pseudobdellovibrionaceae bacterium]